MQPIASYVEELGDKAYRDKEVLETLYHDYDRTQRDIGEFFDVRRATINRWMNRLDVDARSKSEAMRLRKARNPAELMMDSKGHVAWRTRCGERGDDGERPKVWVSVHRLTAVAEYGLEAVKDKHIHHVHFIPWLNYADSDRLGPGLVPLDPEEHHRIHNEAGVPVGSARHPSANPETTGEPAAAVADD